MIELEVTNLNTNVKLNFPSKLILVETVEGMDGLDADIESSSSMNLDGSKYICTNVKERSPSIKFGIRTTNKKEIDECKRILLKFFKHKDEIKIFYKGKYANSYVESAPKFSKGEVATHVDVVFKCNDPYLYSNEIKKEIALWRNDFHFPVKCNPDDRIVLGHREQSLIVNVKNNGDISTGMRIIFKATGTVVNPSLFDLNTRKYIKLSITLTYGQQVIVNTNKGNKKIILNDNGVETKIMNHLDISSTFLQLNQGDNLFRYDAEENLNNLSVDIYYYERYVGV